VFFKVTIVKVFIESVCPFSRG